MHKKYLMKVLFVILVINTLLPPPLRTYIIRFIYFFFFWYVGFFSIDIIVCKGRLTLLC